MYHMVYYKALLLNVKINVKYIIEIFLEKPRNSMRSLSKLQTSFDHTSKFYVGSNF